MVSALSTRESCLIWIATSAFIIAAATATRLPVVKACDHGRTITSTPRKPAATASQRRARTTSPNHSAAAMVMKIGEEYASEIACAIGRWPIAQNPQYMLTKPIAQRTK